MCSLYAALPEPDSRVEAAILRDFGKALSKLVRKVDKREDEIREIARQQAVQRMEANQKMVAMSHEGQPLATNAWREGPGEWCHSLPSNGGAGVPRSSFQHMLQVVSFTDNILPVQACCVREDRKLFEDKNLSVGGSFLSKRRVNHDYHLIQEACEYKRIPGQPGIPYSIKRIESFLAALQMDTMGYVLNATCSLQAPLPPQQAHLAAAPLANFEGPTPQGALPDSQAAVYNHAPVSGGYPPPSHSERSEFMQRPDSAGADSSVPPPSGQAAYVPPPSPTSTFMSPPPGELSHYTSSH